MPFSLFIVVNKKETLLPVEGGAFAVAKAEAALRCRARDGWSCLRRRPARSRRLTGLAFRSPIDVTGRFQTNPVCLVILQRKEIMKNQDG